ncbi:MAG: hypothetical protein ACE5H1_01245 [Thermodesulfobacteriota bacterium]
MEKKKRDYDPHVVGEQIKLLFQMAASIPDQAIKDTMEYMDQEQTIGPLFRPGEFMGNKFDQLRLRMRRCQAVLDFKKVLLETDEAKNVEV